MLNQGGRQAADRRGRTRTAAREIDWISWGQVAGTGKLEASEAISVVQGQSTCHAGCHGLDGATERLRLEMAGDTRDSRTRRVLLGRMTVQSRVLDGMSYLALAVTRGGRLAEKSSSFAGWSQSITIRPLATVRTLATTLPRPQSPQNGLHLLSSPFYNYSLSIGMACHALKNVQRRVPDD